MGKEQEEVTGYLGVVLARRKATGGVLSAVAVARRPWRRRSGEGGRARSGRGGSVGGGECAWGLGGGQGELGRRLGVGRRAAAMAQPCLLTLELEEEEGERGAGNSRRIRHTGCAWGG